MYLLIYVTCLCKGVSTIPRVRRRTGLQYTIRILYSIVHGLFTPFVSVSQPK